jgi:micrococcal nuclease
VENRTRISALFVVLVLSSALVCGFGGPPPEREFAVKWVIDGDTIILAGGERVRYIGIDTPEMKNKWQDGEFFGPEATEANRKLVQGRKVRMEYDVQRIDKYNRTLAYVYVDDIFVNAWLVENGYANVMTIPPNVKYSKIFVSFEAEARNNNKGLWRKR